MTIRTSNEELTPEDIRALLMQMVISSNAGVPLFYRSLIDSETDSSLISGFLTAISKLMQVVVHNTETSLNRILLQGMQFVFLERPKFSVIFHLKSEVDYICLEPCINRIADAFEQKFNEILPTNGNYTGSIQVFDRFKSDIAWFIGESSSDDKTIKSSNILQQFLGVKGKINFKRVLDQL